MPCDVFPVHAPIPLPGQEASGEVQTCRHGPRSGLLLSSRRHGLWHPPEATAKPSARFRRDDLKTAAVNAPHSRRFAQFEDARPSRSIWTARVFSTAFRRGMTDRQIQPREFQGDGERFPCQSSRSISPIVLWSVKSKPDEPTFLWRQSGLAARPKGISRRER